MRIMFEAISVTNETSYVPGTGHAGEEEEEHDDGEDGEADGEGEGVHHRSPQVLTKGQLHLQGEPQVPLLERKRKHIGIPL